MKKIYSLFILLSIGSLSLKSQVTKTVSPEEYDKLKKNNELKKDTYYYLNVEGYKEQAPVSSDKVKHSKVEKTEDAASCDCMQPLDNTFSVVPFSGYSSPDYRNDDASTISIPLGFNFCLYGTTYTNVYINNNGNVTFDSPYSTFSATGFPSSSYVMVAPFWGDVDTRNTASGVVHYKINAHSMIVKWDAVGYYNQYVDKVNTFQLIISDGTDSLVPNGNNVSFCYGDMQWTTGDASQGTNGFGGVAATVGVNKGDGTNYIQVGRYDQAGTAYDGPYGNNDGISWLDNKYFSFDACGSAGNLPPLTLTGASGACAADTITLCAYEDTLVIEEIFTAPESNQSLTFTTSAPTLGGNFQLLSSSGNAGTDTVRFILIGNSSLVGTHNVSIVATDNGTPALSTTLNYVIVIPNATLPPPSLSSTPPPICAGSGGQTMTLNNCATYTNIVWSDGTTGCSTTYDSTGSQFVTVIASTGCQRSSFFNINILENPIPNITGITNYCGSSGTTLSVTVSGSTAPITDYSWSGAVTATTPTVFVNSSGNENIMVTDANGCTGTDVVTVSNTAPTVTILPSVTSFCPGVPVTLVSSISNGDSYTWTASAGGPFPDNDTIIVNPTASTTYSLSVSVNGCVSSTTLTLTPISGGALITGFTNPAYCIGSTPSLSAIYQPGGATITWTDVNSNTQTGSSIIPTPGMTYTVVANVSGQCSSSSQTVTAVQPNPLPSAQIFSYSPNNSLAHDTVICFKQTKVLTADYANGTAPITDTTGYQYTWTPATSSTAHNNSLTCNGDGQYVLTVVDSNGCINHDTMNLVMVTPTLAAVNPTNYICPDSSATITYTGTSPSSYTITISHSNTIVSNTNTVTSNSSGLYTATLIDEDGCTATANASIVLNAVPHASFTADPEVSEIEAPVLYLSNSTITTGTVTACYWNFGDGTTASTSGEQIHSYDAPGTYPVTLITVSNKGCKDTVSMDHEVIVIIPIVNIITPNGDNVNNALYFKGLEFFPGSKIAIYNRWGKKIYESDNYDNKWTGADQQDGTYYYILEVPGLKYQDNQITSFFQIIH